MDALGLILVFVAVVNPFRAVTSVASPLWRTARAVAVVAAAVAAVVAVVLAAVHDEVLDVLDVTAPTFRLGAGLVIAVTGLRSLLLAPRPWEDGVADGKLAVLVPIAFPILVTPELAVSAVSFAADEGTGVAVLGALVALALFAALGSWRAATETPRAWLTGLGRLAGGGAVVIGISRIVSGIFDV
jgi:small neutral amino acid transporter SnatA (MarC family)